MSRRVRHMAPRAVTLGLIEHSLGMELREGRRNRWKRRKQRLD